MWPTSPGMFQAPPAQMVAMNMTQLLTNPRLLLLFELWQLILLAVDVPGAFPGVPINSSWHVQNAANINPSSLTTPLIPIPLLGSETIFSSLHFAKPGKSLSRTCPALVAEGRGQYRSHSPQCHHGKTQSSNIWDGKEKMLSSIQLLHFSPKSQRGCGQVCICQCFKQAELITDARVFIWTSAPFCPLGSIWRALGLSQQASVCICLVLETGSVKSWGFWLISNENLPQRPASIKSGHKGWFLHLSQHKPSVDYSRTCPCRLLVGQCWHSYRLGLSGGSQNLVNSGSSLWEWGNKHRARESHRKQTALQLHYHKCFFFSSLCESSSPCISSKICWGRGAPWLDTSTSPPSSNQELVNHCWLFFSKTFISLKFNYWFN